MDNSTDPVPLATQFREHFGHREHLYGVLLDAFADDLEAGGPVAAICRDHLNARRRDVIQLRLLAGIFRIVLRGDAPELRAFYPCLGGTADPSGAWPVVRPLLITYVDELRAALDRPPQTNEVGRSAGLLVGVFDAVRRSGLHRIRLLEPGASAGLNLNVDRYRFVGPDWEWGDPRSPRSIDTGCAGVRPVDFVIVGRRGCDLAPVGASERRGADYLTSFVWPFDVDRRARLAAALKIDARHPVPVDEASASTWLGEQLDLPVPDEVLTVVWQSITQQYWPPAESAATLATIESARARIPLAHIAMEGIPPRQASGGFDIARHGPTVTVDGRVIARSHHHGPPLHLTDQ
jgi:hypothetical protein